jgi:hypothetical protein
MAENASSCVRTRHMKTKDHFIWKQVEDCLITTEIVKTEEKYIFIHQKYQQGYLQETCGEEGC